MIDNVLGALNFLNQNQIDQKVVVENVNNLLMTIDAVLAWKYVVLF